MKVKAWSPPRPAWAVDVGQVDDVGARDEALDQVAAADARRGLRDGIVVEEVGPAAAVQAVSAVPAGDGVVVGAAPDHVGSVTADQRVIAGPAEDLVVAVEAFDVIGAVVVRPANRQGWRPGCSRCPVSVSSPWPKANPARRSTLTATFSASKRGNVAGSRGLRTTVEDVVPQAALEHVIADLAAEKVVAASAVDHVVAGESCVDGDGSTSHRMKSPYSWSAVSPPVNVSAPARSCPPKTLPASPERRLTEVRLPTRVSLPALMLWLDRFVCRPQRR